MREVATWAGTYGCFPHLHKRPIHIHHVLGRKAKQNKVEIGLEYILPIDYHYHDVGRVHDLNVTHYPKNFESEFGSQRSMFKFMVDDMKQKGYDVIPEDYVIELICNHTKCWDWGKEFEF